MDNPFSLEKIDREKQLNGYGTDILLSEFDILLNGY
jgi:hypothetical protein